MKNSGMNLLMIFNFKISAYDQKWLQNFFNAVETQLKLRQYITGIR